MNCLHVGLNQIFPDTIGNVLFQQNSDMTDEMRTETVELVVTACEKFSGNNEVFVFYLCHN